MGFGPPQRYTSKLIPRSAFPSDRTINGKEVDTPLFPFNIIIYLLQFRVSHPQWMV